MAGRAGARSRPFLNLNPFTHLAMSYQEILFYHGPVRPLEVAARAARRRALFGWSAVPGRLLRIRSIRGCGTVRFARAQCDGTRGPWLCDDALIVNAIELNVTKIYRRYARREQFATLKSALLLGQPDRDLQARRNVPRRCKDVSFSVPKGCTFGIIGRNGSGKSTALKLVAGITKPTTGTVTVERAHLGAHRARRRVSSRRSPAARTSSSTASCSASRKREITRRFDEIVEFAELEDFIDAPVKTYSSGMYMRLGFAVAIHVDPDVLLVDEVLAVGDEGVHAQVPRQVRRVPPPRQDDPARHALARASSSGSATRRSGSTTAARTPRATRGASCRRLPDRRREERGDDRWPLTRREGRAQARRRTAADGGAASRRPEPGRRRRREAERRRTCSRRPRAAGARARSKSPTWRSSAATAQPAHVFHSGERDDHSSAGCTARDAARPISSSASASSTPTASAATAPTRTSRK